MIRERLWYALTVGVLLMLAALACTNPLSGNPLDDQVEEAGGIEEVIEAEKVEEIEEATVLTEEILETEEAAETIVDPEASQSETPEPPTPTATPEPSSTPTLVPEPQIELPLSHRNKTSGFSMRLPENWVVKDLPLITYAAVDKSTLDQLLLSDDITAPVIIAVVGSPEQLEVTADSVEEFARQVMGDFDPDVIVSTSDPVSLTVGGLDALLIDIDGLYPETGQYWTTRMIPILGSQHAGIFYGMSPQSNWEDFNPIFDAVIESVEFFEPTQ